MIPVMIGKKEYLIKGEEKNWIVGEMKMIAKKKGDEKLLKFVPDSYYSTTEGLFKGLMERKLRATDLNSLSELTTAILRAKDELKGLYDVSPNKVA